MNTAPLTLTTARLLLREFRPGDFAALYEIFGDPATQRYIHGALTEEQVRAKLQEDLDDQLAQPRTRRRFAITNPPADDLRGIVIFNLQPPEIREYEIGWALHKQDRGKGIATEAARAVLEFGFTHLHAHRVTAFCQAENTASIHIMEKLGMRQEGQLHEAVWESDAWHDECIYAILEREFQG